MKRDLLDVSEGEASFVDDSLLPLVGVERHCPESLDNHRLFKKDLMFYTYRTLVQRLLKYNKRFTYL